MQVEFPFISRTVLPGTLETIRRSQRPDSR